MKEPDPLQQFNRTWVQWGRRKLAYFSGCDYFRLSSHPQVLAAATGVIRKAGLNVAASRFTSGNHRLYSELERILARFFGTETALLTPTGYLAASAVGQALAGTFSHALLDELAHPALADAAQFFDCPILRYRHRDTDDFRRCVDRCGRGARLIVLTDGVFSVDGTLAPLRAIAEELPRDGMLLVDDAHGAGVIGATGKGTVEVEGLGGDERVIRCITLSKAFGSYGGAVLGAQWLRERMVERSRLMRGATPIPLPMAGAALAAIRILKSDRMLRRRLNANADYVKGILRAIGIELPESPSPIVGMAVESERAAERWTRQLLKAGIYPPLMRYPGVGGRLHLRFAISSEHTRAQLDSLVNCVSHAVDSKRRLNRAS